MSARDFVGRSIVVLSFWMCSVLAAMAQGVGAIGGTILDESGAVLPGATVTLSNPRGTIGGNDVSVRKTWKVGWRSVEPRMDLHNLTNAATILGRITQLGPTYGQVSSIQRGRLIKLGLNLEF